MKCAAMIHQIAVHQGSSASPDRPPPQTATSRQRASNPRPQRAASKPLAANPQPPPASSQPVTGPLTGAPHSATDAQLTAPLARLHLVDTSLLTGENVSEDSGSPPQAASPPLTESEPGTPPAQQLPLSPFLRIFSPFYEPFSPLPPKPLDCLADDPLAAPAGSQDPLE